MNQYSTTGGSGNNNNAPPPKKSCYKKGLGFVPNSISSSHTDPITTMIKDAPKIAKGQCAYSVPSSILTDSKPTVPLFDLEEMSEASGEKRKRALASFGTAFLQVGVLGIKAPNLSKLTKGVYEEMNRYFRQPLESKLLNWKKGDLQYGYCYRGSEVGPHAPRPDFKESFFITPNFSEWPANNRAFPRTMNEYHASLTRAYQYVSMFLMEFLGEPDDGSLAGKANNILRLAYYPAFKPGDDPNGIWSAANRDRNFLTISSVGSIPGLQFYSNKGLWEPVVVPENYLIISCGLLLQHKTAGLIKARWKRVVNPGGKYTRLQRLSTVFYGTWPEDCSLKPFTTCISKATNGMSAVRREEYLKKYQDITVKERLTHRETASSH